MEELNIKGTNKIGTYYGILKFVNILGLVLSSLLAFLGIILILIGFAAAIYPLSYVGIALFFYGAILVLITMFSMLSLKVICSSYYDAKIIRSNTEKILTKLDASTPLPLTSAVATSAPTYTPKYKAKKSSKWPLILLLAVIAVIAVIGANYFNLI